MLTRQLLYQLSYTGVKSLASKVRGIRHVKPQLLIIRVSWIHESDPLLRRECPDASVNVIAVESMKTVSVVHLYVSEFNLVVRIRRLNTDDNTTPIIVYRWGPEVKLIAGVQCLQPDDSHPIPNLQNCI